MSKREIIENFVDRWIEEWGYVPTQSEIMQQYTDGMLILSDKEEDILSEILHDM